MRITEGTLDHPAVRELIAEHLRDMHATSPPESIHALDLDALTGPGMTFWSAWFDPEEVLAGCAALKELDPAHGEIKTMRTCAAARGRGVADTMVEHLVSVASARGYARLSLETGVEDYFAAARRLYRRHGFTECPPFGSYVPDPNSVFMTRMLG
ncbi:GNAT family N-acetyltransferase [Nesterenkonia sp. LB17]|uniref:GNAT family N-acetyltransferase n=1 Tax=unclassified Nesterenkonia TaxID=2629769 RepID=UPI001F4CD2CC|nr:MULTISPECIES: GNAT family N-acetyltransferase [unclassified Nesterenkonia]MCH8560843.1 GNAT family N-acetyltransferase [Nesterenkonia sp. DZ6]MCH8566198.1 GNAT family N-acetyltransferase [Nesterenkonia sp. LB17]MCH8570923.1 GNAT family N-acetyltransferase [Nesterenkonia sp. AY15]